MLVRGQYVVCRPRADAIVRDGAVRVYRRKITDVGPYADLRARYPAEPEVGTEHHVVFPGLVNSHHHAKGLSTLQTGVLDDNLELWLLEIGVVDRLDPYDDVLYNALQLLQSGVTTVIDSHTTYGGDDPIGTTSRALQAYLDAGLRVAFAVPFFDQNRFVYGPDAEFLATLPPDLRARLEAARGVRARATLEDLVAHFEALVRAFHGAEHRVKVFLGPVGIQWCSDTLLTRVRDLAEKHDTGIHTHLLETLYQKRYGLERLGATLGGHLDALGFLSPRVSFAHSVWLTERDIDLLAARGATPVHNASSNLRLKSGIAPVLAMLDAGVNVAVGMDSSSTNDDEDMWQDLRLVGRLHRPPGIGGRTITAEEVFTMATANGARAAQWGETTGALEPGRWADLVLVRLDRITAPYTDPGVPLLDLLLARAKAADVDYVMVQGEWRLKKGRLVKHNLADVAARLRERAVRLAPFGERAAAQLMREVKPYVFAYYARQSETPPTPFYTFNARQ